MSTRPFSYTLFLEIAPGNYGGREGRGRGGPGSGAGVTVQMVRTPEETARDQSRDLAILIKEKKADTHTRTHTHNTQHTDHTQHARPHSTVQYSTVKYGTVHTQPLD